MSDHDERTPLLSGMRRSATSSAQTDAASQTSHDPSLRVERRQTWPATRSFFSSAKDSVVSACQTVASTLLPPTPTKEELDEVLSGWSELGQEELKSQLTNAALDHYPDQIFSPPNAKPNEHLSTRSLTPKPRHVKFRHLLRHLDRVSGDTSGKESGADADTTLDADNGTINTSRHLTPRLQTLNIDSLAYETQGFSCYAGLIRVPPPEWADVVAVVDDGAQVCRERYELSGTKAKSDSPSSS